MSTTPTDDSTDPWRFVIVLSKFFILFVDSGLAKSFGVLIPGMVARYGTNYQTMAFICSLPPTVTFITGKN